MSIGFSAEALAALALALAGHNLYLGVTVVVLAGAASGPGMVAPNALVADVVCKSRQEAAYATLRAATDVGYVAGPSLGAAALASGHWKWGSWQRFLLRRYSRTLFLDRTRHHVPCGRAASGMA